LRKTIPPKPLTADKRLLLFPTLCKQEEGRPKQEEVPN
jgi:hypothetical protein